MGQGLKKITQLKASFLPGAQVWVVPMSTHSAWYKKLNWYTSSQLSLWTYKNKPYFQEPLKKIIQEEQLPFSDKEKENQACVLVFTPNVFPNQSVLGIDANLGLENWMNELNKKVNSLQADSLRIFWGENQVEDLMNQVKKNQFKSLNKIEIVVCEPDPL